MDDRGFSQMNVMPLVDIMLVLLTIVLTTASFVQTGVIPVNLPQGKPGQSSSSLAPSKSLVMEINAQGQVHHQGQPLLLDELDHRLAAWDRQSPVLIRADRQTDLQPFVELLEGLKSQGFNDIKLQLEARP